MKSILMSIKPKFVAKILNKEKKIEIRKRFPLSYRGWVYIYCTKEDNLCCIKKVAHNDRYICGKDFDLKDFPQLSSGYEGKGKVVACFYCDNVEEIKRTERQDVELLEKSCLTGTELYDYLLNEPTLNEIIGYAIHISQLEIFDDSKELCEFYPYCKDYKCEYRNNHCSICRRTPLTRAPQSYMYIEEELL